MNIDMRNIPESFEKNIRDIMNKENIMTASKALQWALIDRLRMINELERKNKIITENRNEIRDLTRYKDCVLILKETMKSRDKK